MPNKPDPVCAETGAWSATAGDVRGRLVRSGDRIELELENASQQPHELRWDGTHLGFATFRLDDASGVEVPEPSWRYGGNEMVGSQSLQLPPGTTRVVIGDPIYGSMMGHRTIRIGAFWGRELPDDGSPRFLRARVAADPAIDIPAVCVRASLQL